MTLIQHSVQIWLAVQTLSQEYCKLIGRLILEINEKATLNIHMPIDHCLNYYVG